MVDLRVTNDKGCFECREIYCDDIKARKKGEGIRKHDFMRQFQMHDGQHTC